jgi:hypothetical protein
MAADICLNSQGNPLASLAFAKIFSPKFGFGFDDGLGVALLVGLGFFELTVGFTTVEFEVDVGVVPSSVIQHLNASGPGHKF